MSLNSFNNTAVLCLAGDCGQRWKQQAPLLYNPISVQAIYISWGGVHTWCRPQCFCTTHFFLIVLWGGDTWHIVSQILLPPFHHIPPNFKIVPACLCFPQLMAVDTLPMSYATSFLTTGPYCSSSWPSCSNTAQWNELTSDQTSTNPPWPFLRYLFPAAQSRQFTLLWYVTVWRLSRALTSVVVETVERCMCRGQFGAVITRFGGSFLHAVRMKNMWRGSRRWFVWVWFAQKAFSTRTVSSSGSKHPLLSVFDFTC